MSIEYDPQEMEKNGHHLYWAATVTSALYPVVGIVVGSAIGFSLFKLTLLKAAGAVGGGFIGGYLGDRQGNVKATEMRAQAQSALCLAEIERNTRALHEHQRLEVQAAQAALLKGNSRSLFRRFFKKSNPTLPSTASNPDANDSQ